MPFYWYYPQSLRDRLIARWARRMPVWSVFMRDTRVLSRQRMAQLFPESTLFVERFLGMEKSYAFYKPWTPRARDLCLLPSSILGTAHRRT